MNLRLYSIALLISAIPQLSAAESGNVTFNHGDFIAAERSTEGGAKHVQLRLSKSGKAKLKKLRSASS